MRIVVEDSGVGIDKEVIDKIYKNLMPHTKIGLYNVHSRIKLIYGEGVNIIKLKKGTKIEFFIEGE